MSQAAVSAWCWTYLMRSIALTIPLLLEKFANLDIPDLLLHWLSPFVCQHRQRVKLGPARSEWTSIKAGLPQGTVPDPVSFLLHINDLRAICSGVNYVDDTTIWESCSADLIRNFKFSCHQLYCTEFNIRLAK